MTDTDPITQDTVATLDPLTCPVHRSPHNGLYAYTTLGWQHVALIDTMWTSDSGPENLFHALRLMTLASRRLPVTDDGATLTGIHAIAWHTCDRTVSPPRRVVEAVDTHGAVFLLRRDGDNLAHAWAPPDAGRRGASAALRQLVRAWAATAGLPTATWAAYDTLHRDAASSLPDGMAPETQRWCLAAAGHLLATHVADELQRRAVTDADARIGDWARAVSDRLSTAIDDGQVSLDDAQTLVIDLELPPLAVAHTVRLGVCVLVEVRANCDDAAADAARDRIEELLKTYDSDFDIDAITVEHIQGPDHHPQRLDIEATNQRAYRHDQPNRHR